MSEGVFITFEGDDGVGKSTHVRFLIDRLEERGREVVHVREPGCTALGERIRDILLDPGNSEMTPEAELLLYEAARAQVVREVIKPALERGAVVVCDRFIDSTVAYQGAGRGLDMGFIDAANDFATGGVVPDATILLAVLDGDKKKARVKKAMSADKDRLESEEGAFFDRLNDAFLKAAEEHPERIVLVDAGGAHSSTARNIAESLAGLVPELASDPESLDAALAALDKAHDHTSRESDEQEPGRRIPAAGEEEGCVACG